MNYLTATQVVLERLKFKVERRISMEGLAQSVEAEAFLDHMANRMVVQLCGDVLAERLPPQHVRHVTYEPRHASWWQHLKATYRGRWWWPAALSDVRYVDVPVVVHLRIRDHWTYPRAPRIESHSLGGAVLGSQWEVDDER